MVIQMRQGNEVDFDAEKMLPGEWAVSTDAKIVRMCFAPGIVARMATYEAFEADMVKIEAILKNVQDIQTAVKLVQAEINGKSELVAENASLAEEYMFKAKEYAEQAGAFTGMQIAKRDLLGVVKGGDMAVEDDGALRNFKRGSGNTFAVSDTVEAPLSDIKLYGKSVQETVPGNQLLNMSGAKGGESNGITVTINDDGSYSFVGTATDIAINVWILGSFINTSALFTLPSGDYYLSGVRIYSYDGTTRPSFEGAFTLTEETPITAVRAKAAVVGTTYNETIYPMLNAGSTALPYEPYTGGIPSPNPSYPQEIKSVVVDEVKVCGKNLFNFSDIEYMFVNSSGAEMKGASFINAGTYTISENGKLNGTLYAKVISSDGTYGATQYANPKVTVTIESGQTLLVYTEDISMDLLESAEVQVEIGEKQTSYSPYTENTATLSQPITLNGIGDVRDELTPDGVVRKFAEVVFDGSEHWVYDEAKGRIYTTHISQMIKTISNNLVPNILCDTFIAKTFTQIYSALEDGICVSESGNVSLKYKGFTTETEWREFIAGNHITVIYELATPITEPLPEADQIALRSLHSYDGVTTVMSDAWTEVECATSNVAALAMYIKRDYVPKAKYDALESRISALEQQIVNA